MRKNKFILGSIIVLLLVLFTGTVAQAQNTTPTPSPASPDHVVILVVDDFTPNTEEDIANVLSKTENVNKSDETETADNPDDPKLCYFNPSSLVEGQAMADGMGGSVSDDSGMRISHGDLVLGQILEMISKAQPSTYFPSVDITAVPVSVQNYDIATITNAIKTTIDTLTAQLGSGTFFVINMSFALVPCREYANLADLIADFNQAVTAMGKHIPSDTAIWDAFKNTLDAVNTDVTQVNEITTNLTDGRCTLLPSGEPPTTEATEQTEATQQAEATEKVETTREVITDFQECTIRQIFFDENVIAVASSGNFGLDFPTLPAAWEGVLSVSAGPECDGFDSVGGSNDRLISQRLSFRPILNPTPCLSAQNINTLVNTFSFTKVFSSSKGEIMMPGTWNYGTGLNNVRNLITSSDPIISSAATVAAMLPTTAGSDEFGKFVNRIQNIYNLRAYGFVPGTSFAAPRMSFAAAIYLADSLQNGFSICRGAKNIIGLAYANHSSPAAWNGQDLSLGNHPNGQINCPALHAPGLTKAILGL